ncbi:MAG: hypothetical protein ACOYXT_04540, partial [Bacteroidota bacterium]
LTRIGSGSVIVAVFLLTLTAYQENPRPKPHKVCVNCSTDDFVGVPLKEFMMDVARYNGTHAKDILSELRTETPQDLPSRTCMYSLGRIKEFICQMERYTVKAGLNPDDLGIRFYYGIYPEKKKIAGQLYEGLHTLFMVPSIYDSRSQRYIDFDPKATAEKRYNNELYKGIYKKAQFTPQHNFAALADLVPLALADSSIVIFMLDASAVKPPVGSIVGMAPVETSVMNQGQLCPPNCPPRNFLNVIDETFGPLNYDQ